MDNLVELAILIGVAGGLSVVGVLVFDRPFVVAGCTSIAVGVLLAVAGTYQSVAPDPVTIVVLFSIALGLVFGSL